MISLKLFVILNLFCCSLLYDVVISEQNQDFYDLLGISRDADNKEIRKAFKKLALTLHPDKNKDDPQAHEKFLQINRAYEILKDDETRKRYDMHGEEGLKEEFGQRRYQSWSYYNEEFGIYDNDEEIVTLSRVDFDQSVRQSPYIWFINFYSPQCSHCHHLAPEWRKLAKELQDVIRIGAVNCEEDWMLCRQESVHSYPSLLVYPEKEKYNGRRESDFMSEFILQKVTDSIIKIDESNYKNFHLEQIQTSLNQKKWLIIFCHDEQEECLFTDTKKKLSSMLNGIVNVAEVNCNKNGKMACEEFRVSDSKIILYPDIYDKLNYFEIGDFDKVAEARDIFKNVLSKIPNLKKLNSKEIKKILDELKNSESFYHPWLFYFSNAASDTENIQTEMKRLPSLLPEVNVGKINCDVEIKLCDQFYVKKFPAFIVLKRMASYEFYHGRQSAFDIANFVRESLSSNIQAFDLETFEERIKISERPLFVDFFAPWCPPCMNLLPEVRKTSRKVGHLIDFATVDCTLHQSFCQKYNIRSYPTLLIYNKSQPNQFFGKHSEDDLIEFIQDILNPSTIKITPDLYNELIEKRNNNLWLVDFFAPWCGPCQQLTPEWRKLAKLLKDEENVFVGQVDCQIFNGFCSEQMIKSYPTIRLYPSKLQDKKISFHTYQGHRRDATSIRMWAYNFIRSVVKDINSQELYKKVLKSKNTWIIDFYAPWCGHCLTFAPEFELTAKKLKSNDVKAGKVNCQDHPEICSAAGVHAYPTLKLYFNSNQPTRSKREIFIDAYSSEDILKFVNEQLDHSKKNVSLKDEL